jgi:hypothetical protein
LHSYVLVLSLLIFQIEKNKQAKDLKNNLNNILELDKEIMNISYGARGKGNKTPPADSILAAQLSGDKV